MYDEMANFDKCNGQFTAERRIKMNAFNKVCSTLGEQTIRSEFISHRVPLAIFSRLFVDDSWKTFGVDID